MPASATKRNVLGVCVDAVDYDLAVARIVAAAAAHQAMAVSAVAVHGIMTGVLDDAHRHRLNSLDLLVPDGQPVRWALNLLYRSRLGDRVYGPELMLRLCEAAANHNLPVFLYGSTDKVLSSLGQTLAKHFPTLRVTGSQPSRFRRLSVEERDQVVETIIRSGAMIVFVGLGCPRQEVWVYENRHLIGKPLIAVGAAFDFHAGLLRQAPPSFQKHGFEWLFRLTQEPRRLWRRYLYLNPLYLALLALQTLRVWRPVANAGLQPTSDERFG